MRSVRMTNKVELCRDDGGFFRHTGVSQYLYGS